MLGMVILGFATEGRKKDVVRISVCVSERITVSICGTLELVRVKLGRLFRGRMLKENIAQYCIF